MYNSFHDMCLSAFLLNGLVASRLENLSVIVCFEENFCNMWALGMYVF